MNDIKRVQSRRPAATMTSILRRPFDLLIVGCVLFFLLIAVTIAACSLHDQSFSLTSDDNLRDTVQTTSYWVPEDQGTGVMMSQYFTQVIYGSIMEMKNLEGLWPPPQILKAYVGWAENYDPLLLKNPMWLETMLWFSPFLYAPLYVLIIYAFILEKEWIRIPVLMWGYGELLSMCVVMREELFGQYAAPDRLRFALAYGGYVIIPILMMLRVACTPVFGARKLHHE